MPLWRLHSQRFPCVVLNLGYCADQPPTERQLEAIQCPIGHHSHKTSDGKAHESTEIQRTSSATGMQVRLETRKKSLSMTTTLCMPVTAFLSKDDDSSQPLHARASSQVRRRAVETKTCICICVMFMNFPTIALKFTLSTKIQSS